MLAGNKAEPLSRPGCFHLHEDAVRAALDSLNRKGLAGTASGADSRVTKFEHRLQEAFNFSRPETAVLCVLLLRGPQTAGEIRGRTGRLHDFAGLEAVDATLQALHGRGLGTENERQGLESGWQNDMEFPLLQARMAPSL